MPLASSWQDLRTYADEHRVWVSLDFLRYPSCGVTVDWSAVPCGLLQHFRLYHPCEPSCLKGLIVRLDTPQRVWRLTGQIQIRHEAWTVGYEAIWPD